MSKKGNNKKNRGDNAAKARGDAVAKLDAVFVAVAVMIVLANIVGKLGLWQGFSGSTFGLIAGIILLLWSMMGVANNRRGK